MDSGAHYFKTDLQVHTPRDRAWTGKRPVSDEERERYARSFVSSCRAKGLQAVAITDHHDIALLPFIRNAVASEVGVSGKTLGTEQQLVVFPGVELTLAVPCQALLLFDADFSARCHMTNPKMTDGELIWRRGEEAHKRIFGRDDRTLEEREAELDLFAQLEWAALLAPRYDDAQ